MAIEDEIINISDIDVGTEILNNDKLIIETNNGTKLLAFKDLVIGEDNIKDLDPETIYFLNRILNDLNLKKIRNNILSEALPVRV